ncbi:MAG: hypothetical protein H6581_11605 [Bacteroidia bacterium]|nr:hypothetical protein [Bacteroidia bacterium]
MKGVFEPSCYLYRPSEKGLELYLGDFTTLDALRILHPDTRVESIIVGASSYQNYGWATEKEFPAWQTVGEIVTFLEQEGEFGLIEFEVRLAGLGSLRTHDDGECHFLLHEKGDLARIIRQVAPPAWQDKLIAGLLQFPGLYLTLDSKGNLKRYASFEQYLKAVAGQ